jgi:hypothetical protein
MLVLLYLHFMLSEFPPFCLSRLALVHFADVSAL